MKHLTLQEVAKLLQIAPSTIYHNGPALYGGVKIGGLWRFPEDKIGIPPEKPKAKEPNVGYVRRFGKSRFKVVQAGGGHG